MPSPTIASARRGPAPGYAPLTHSQELPSGFFGAQTPPQQRRQRPQSAPRVAAPAVREPEAFAREMTQMRERYRGEHLSPQQRDRLVLDSYDGFLGELRRQEQMLLAKRRQAELDRVRGPLPYWWEMKHVEFSAEMRRQRQMLSGELNPRYEEVLTESPL